MQFKSGEKLKSPLILLSCVRERCYTISGRLITYSPTFMAFFGPLITMVFNKEKYDRLLFIFERRESIDVLIEKIQEADIAQPKKNSKRSKK